MLLKGPFSRPSNNVKKNCDFVIFPIFIFIFYFLFILIFCCLQRWEMGRQQRHGWENTPTCVHYTGTETKPDLTQYTIGWSVFNFFDRTEDGTLPKVMYNFRSPHLNFRRMYCVLHNTPACSMMWIDCGFRSNLNPDPNLDPNSGTLWIRICIPNTGCIKFKIG